MVSGIAKLLFEREKKRNTTNCIKKEKHTERKSMK